MNRPTDPSPVRILALARLLAAADKGEAEKTLSKDLLPLVKHRWDGREWADRLGRALDELESAGALRRIKTGKTTRLALTDDGRRLALEALGIGGMPATPTWAKLKSGLLPALALGRAGEGGVNLKVEILRSHYALPLGDRAKVQDATEAMAAKLMGLGPGRKFTMDNILGKLLLDAGIEIPPGKKPGPTTIRDALFSRELGDPSAKKPLDLLVTRSVRAQNNKAGELADAVLRGWIDRSEGAGATAGDHAPPSLADFARRVVEAARGSRTGWFGDDEVFISHVWKALAGDLAFRGMDLESFKGRLVEAHRARLLELGRADLVEAMDPRDVGESATPYLNAVYHFVRNEGQAR